MKRSRLVLVVLGVMLTASPALGSAAAPDAMSRPAVTCNGAIPWQRAPTLVGRVATIVGRVASTKYASSSNGSPTFLDIGRPYPNEGLAVVIWIENRAAFGHPEIRYRGKTICIRGQVSSYDGVPQIEARSPTQITIRR